MLYFLFFVAAVCFSLLTLIHGLYFFLVLRNPKKKQYLEQVESALNGKMSLQQLPQISILVPAYNEEDVVARKLQNIAAMSYPHEKFEVILIDDHSSDKTAEVAEKSLRKLDLTGKIVRNSSRMGVNAAYNVGFAQSTGELILTTDADVTVDNDALIKGVKILAHLKDVGGVTGKMIPVSSNLTSAAIMEEQYRSFYDSMSISESAMYSTFPGYTCFTLLKRSAFSPLPQHYGSSDGNISLATIKKRLRFLYVPSIVFYEPISLKIGEQKRQKIRRSARLIQSILANKDMLFKGEYAAFGKIIFPLRFAMMIASPLLVLIGFAAFVLATLLASVPLGLLGLSFLLLCIFLGAKTNVRKLNAFSSFVIHYFYLLMGLFLSQTKVAAWKPAERSELSSEFQ